MATSFRLEENSSSDNKADGLESSKDNSQTQVDSLPSLLPRAAWNNPVDFLRAIFQTKRALDRIEQEADVANSLVEPIRRKTCL